MARGNESGFVRRIRATRSTGLLPLVAAITSAVALTGAAFYTVDRAGCEDPAQYIRHDNHVELVGGCVDTAELPSVQPGPASQPTPPVVVQHGNYRP
jgi:hypothetical protein